MHLHRLAQGDPAGRRPRAAASGSATCWTGSPSTSRCACTAGSASRSARSTRCTGPRSSSTPSSTSATCCTSKDRLGEWMSTVPPPPAPDAARRRAQGGRRALDRAAVRAPTARPARPRPARREPAQRAGAVTEPRPADGAGRACCCSGWSPRPRAAGRHDPAGRARGAVAGRRPRRGRRLLPAARRRVRRLGAGAGLRRRGRRAGAVRPDADPRADRGQRRGQHEPAAAGPGRRSSARA